MKGPNNLLAVIVGIGLALTLFLQAAPEQAPTRETFGPVPSSLEAQIEEFAPGAELASVRVLDWNLRDGGPHPLALFLAFIGLLGLLAPRTVFAPGVIEDDVRRTALHQAATTSC